MTMECFPLLGSIGAVQRRFFFLKQISEARIKRRVPHTTPGSFEQLIRRVVDREDFCEVVAICDLKLERHAKDECDRPVEGIESRILLIRGHNVVLDSDLAELYGVTTKRLNEQVKRPCRFHVSADLRGNQEFEVAVRDLKTGTRRTALSALCIYRTLGHHGRERPKQSQSHRGQRLRFVFENG
jgi:hypothetical protein